MSLIPRMTLLNLANLWLEEGGFGEATILHNFEYRAGKTHRDLVQELLWAEKDIRDVGPRIQSPQSHLVRHLNRVLKPRKK